MNRRIARKVLNTGAVIDGTVWRIHRRGTVLKALFRLGLSWLLGCLLACSIVHAQSFDAPCDSPEPIRTYADGYNVAKAESRPLMILITQRVCPPCRVAKRLLEDMRAEQSLGDCVLVEIQASDVEARGLMIGRQLSPQLILLDIANVGKMNQASRYAIERIDRQSIVMLLAQLPSKLADAIVLDEFVETIEPPMLASAPEFGATEITWDLATEYKTGDYNGTFTFGSIQYAFDVLSRYLNLRLRRVTRGGQIHVIQSSRNGPGAAWTNGATIKISPTFRFVNEVHCGMVIVHEFLHVGNGTSHHAQDGGIMGPNGGYLLLASDFPWMQKRVWKSALRPTDEPEWFKKYLSRNAVLGSDDGDMFPLLNRQRE